MLYIDEYRIGTSWAEVVPSGGPIIGEKLGFTTQPANAAPAATMSPVVVQVQNAGGASAASNGVPVTLTLTSGSGTLSGTLTQNTDANGKATFSNLSINTAGAGKQLTATASGIGAGLTAAVSATFSIVAPSVGTQLAFTNQPYGAANRGVYFRTNANYWTVKGLEIGFAGDNGIKVEGSHLRFEQCVLHNNGDTGIQIGFGHTDVNPGGQLAAYIEVVNCDSYQNYDSDSSGGDADGFAAKMHCGQGIVFTGCRSWENSDDGWDLFETDYSIVISNCWTWRSAPYGQGNGNGFKLGGDGAGGNSMGTHSAYNCVSFGHKVNGFTQNSHRDGLLVQHCLSFSNGNSGYNYFMEGTLNSGKQNIFRNNVSIPRTGVNGGGFIADNVPVEQNNSWNLVVTANAADYLSILEAAAKAPRQPDGSLPTGFAQLVAGSDLIDKGANVSLPFNVTAPDLGPYEAP